MTTNGLLTTLVYFNGTNGANPLTELVQLADGSFVGTTTFGGDFDSGTVFQMWPDGTFQTLYSFIGGNDGGNPHGTPIQASDGNFYGMTSEGGAYGYGTIYRLSVPFQPVFRSVTQAAGALELTWSTVVGQSYQLQYNTDLTSTNWNALGNIIVATNATSMASDIIGPDGQRFYRVISQ